MFKETLELKMEDLLLFDRACSFVPQNPMLPSSQFIKLVREDKTTSLALSALSHLRLQLPCSQLTNSKRWVWYLDRAPVAAFTSVHSKSKTIFIDKLPDKLLLRSGRHKVTFSAKDTVTGYVPMPQIKAMETKLDAAVLIAAAKFAAPTDIAEHLSCVYLKQKEGVYASDSVALFYYEDDRIPTSVPLPTLMAEACGSLDGKLCLDHTITSMSWSQGLLHQSVSDHCIRKFPLKTFQQLVSEARKAAPLCKLKVDQFTRVLSRLSPFARPGDLVLCEAAIAADELLLVLDIPQGKVADRVKSEKPLNQAIKQWWVIDKLTPWVDFIRHSKGTHIELRLGKGYSIWFSQLGAHGAYLILAEIVR